MVKKVQKTLKPDRKVWVYSGHDETVANMLMTLNLFEPHCPPYTAMILMELRTNSKNEYFVTVKIPLIIYINLLIQRRRRLRNSSFSSTGFL